MHVSHITNIGKMFINAVICFPIEKYVLCSEARLTKIDENFISMQSGIIIAGLTKFIHFEIPVKQSYWIYGIFLLLLSLWVRST